MTLCLMLQWRTFKITNCDLEQRAWMIIHSEGEDLHPFLFEFANCEANQQSREYANHQADGE